MKRVCVYAGANLGVRDDYRAAAAALGQSIARRGMGLVYGGASRGLMGVCADAAIGAGAEVIGVLPKNLEGREIAHLGITKLHIVPTLHERKALMTSLSDAFIALPGGIGTLDELFETATWNYLSVHDKPYGVLNVANYWTPLVALMDSMNAEGFLREDTRSRMVVRETADALLDALLP